MKLDGMPTLAEHLAGTFTVAPRARPTRVHTLEDERPTKANADVRTPEPLQPAIQPINLPMEEPMPRGRKAAAPDTPAANDAPKPKKRGPKPGTKRTRADGQPVGAASFVIDDRGGMEIRDGQQSVRLERADVTRLTTFLDRTKGIRL